MPFDAKQHVASARTKPSSEHVLRAAGPAQPAHPTTSEHDFGRIRVDATSVDGHRSPGAPLEPATRAYFEPRLGRSLNDVRVHTGPAATESAAALHAPAYTLGRDVVFNAGQYQPASPAGQRLLAHELAHVAQQRPGASDAAALPVSQPGDSVERDADRAASAVLAGRPVSLAHAAHPHGIHRAPDAPAPAPPVAQPDIKIGQWLDQHQFAPPENQPASGERHVLLNGEDMTVTAAVKLAADELAQPRELVSSVITAKLAPPAAASPPTLPYLNPAEKIGAGSLVGPVGAFGVSPGIARTVELSTIDDYLTAHDFATPEVRDPTATVVLLDGVETTVDKVTDKAMALLGQYPTLKRSEVLVHIRQKYVAKRTAGPTAQIMVGYTLVPKFAQYVSGAADPDNPLRTQHQFSFTITFPHHAPDSPGFETSLQGTVALTDKGIANIQAGVQLARVKPLLQGWIQISGLAQAMASENWNKTASGSTVIQPAFQGQVGGQVLLTPQFRSGDYKFLTGHVQLGAQVLGGVQVSGGEVTKIASGGLVLNIPF